MSNMFVVALQYNNYSLGVILYKICIHSKLSWLYNNSTDKDLPQIQLKHGVMSGKILIFKKRLIFKEMLILFYRYSKCNEFVDCWDRNRGIFIKGLNH